MSSQINHIYCDLMRLGFLFIPLKYDRDALGHRGPSMAQGIPNIGKFDERLVSILAMDCTE